MEHRSTSTWGCELKYQREWGTSWENIVNLYMRLWIEIPTPLVHGVYCTVNLYMRLWIEIPSPPSPVMNRAGQPLHEVVNWNERLSKRHIQHKSQPLHEVVNWNVSRTTYVPYGSVNLYMRLWIEISPSPAVNWISSGQPLHEVENLLFFCTKKTKMITM